MSDGRGGSVRCGGQVVSESNKPTIELWRRSPFAIGVDDEGQVEREKEREHQPCWLSPFCTLELKAPVVVGGCTMKRQVSM